MKAIKNAAKRIFAAVVNLYRRYPARANSYIASGMVVAAGAFGVVIAPESAAAIVALVVPILLTGEATHRLVSPTVKKARKKPAGK